MHVHPVPDIAVMVRPAGAVSVTDTDVAANLSPAPRLLTMTEYVAPTCPCEKLPLCVLVTVKSGGTRITVESVAELFPVSLSPAVVVTATLLTNGDVALPATVTVTVIGA